jgi:adenine-specific DNA methylase
MGTFYLPPLIKDTNVISSFEGKLKVMLRGNTEIFKNIENSNVKYLNENADKLSSIKANSVDYIYTDPPYSDIINYSELNIVFESWLQSKTNIEQEMIVSKFRQKSIENYSFQFENFLKKSFSILKNKKHLTLVFHHPNIEHWKYVQRAIMSSGFKPEFTKTPTRLLSNSKTSSQHKTKKITQNFLVFNLVKDLNYKPKQLEKMSEEEYLNLVKTLKIEAKKLGYVNKSDIYDFIINRLVFKVELQKLEL